MVGPDRHHGRCDQRYLLGLPRSPKRAPCRASRGCPRRSGSRACSARSTPISPATTGRRPRHGGKLDKDTSTQVGTRPGAARHRVDSCLLALGKGALGAHVRHPAEAPAPGTQARLHHRHGRGQPLPQGGLPATTQRPHRDPRPRTGAPPSINFTGALEAILCIHEESATVSNDNTVRYKRLELQIPAGRHRRHYVKARVRVHEYPDGTMAVFHGPRCMARYHAHGQPIDSQTREAA